MGDPGSGDSLLPGCAKVNRRPRWNFANKPVMKKNQGQTLEAAVKALRDADAKASKQSDPADQARPEKPPAAKRPPRA
jgi:hypothetical protein